MRFPIDQIKSIIEYLEERGAPREHEDYFRRFPLKKDAEIVRNVTCGPCVTDIEELAFEYNYRKHRWELVTYK